MNFPLKSSLHHPCNYRPEMKEFRHNFKKYSCTYKRGSNFLKVENPGIITNASCTYSTDFKKFVTWISRYLLLCTSQEVEYKLSRAAEWHA